MHQAYILLPFAIRFDIVIVLNIADSRITPVAVKNRRKPTFGHFFIDSGAAEEICFLSIKWENNFKEVHSANNLNFRDEIAPFMDSVTQYLENGAIHELYRESAKFLDVREEKASVSAIYKMGMQFSCNAGNDKIPKIDSKAI